MRATGTTAAALRATNEARCERLLQRSGLLEVGDLDWDRCGEVELDDGDIAALVYMRDVEGFTGSYLSGVGAHPTTLADPLVRRFLAVWQAEEAAHAQALDCYLRSYSAARGVAVAPPSVAGDPALGLGERLATRLGGPVGSVVAAAHMTWGAANELLTMNGYRLLAERCGDPLLAALLSRIAAQEARHYSFYLLQAEWRLATSALARVVVRRLLRGSWTPVGVGDGYKTPDEFRLVLAHLVSTPESQRLVARMDRRLAALPGLDRLRIFQDVASAAA